MLRLSWFEWTDSTGSTDFDFDRGACWQPLGPHGLRDGAATDPPRFGAQRPEAEGRGQNMARHGQTESRRNQSTLSQSHPHVGVRHLPHHQ